MARIKETINAITSGEMPTALRIDRKETREISDYRFDRGMSCATRIATTASVAYLVVNAEFRNLAVLAGVFTFSIFLKYVFQD